MAKSPGTYRLPLVLAAIFGLATLVGAGCGLYQDAGYRRGFDFSPSGWERFSSLLFDMVAVLSFNQPSPAPSNLPFAVARICAVLFAATAVIGIVVELWRPAEDTYFRFRFWLSRKGTWLARQVPLPAFLMEIRAWPVRGIVVWLTKMRAKKTVMLVGLGWIGGQLAKELRGDREWRVYGIEWEENSPPALEAHRHGTLVIVGDATERAVRSRAGLEVADEVFIATGDDARNVEIAGDFLRDILDTPETRRTSKKELQCYVHVGDPALLSTLRRHELLRDQPGKIAFHLFSNRENAAHQLFLEGKEHLVDRVAWNEDEEPLEKAAGLTLRSCYAPRPGEVFHLFIFGFGMVGQTFALHAARFAHFAGVAPGTAFRSRLTVFEAFGQPERALERERFFDRFPAFAPSNLSFDPVRAPEDEDTEAVESDPQIARFFAYSEGGIPPDSWQARPARPVHQDFQQDRCVRLRSQPREHEPDTTEYKIEEQSGESTQEPRERDQGWVWPVEYAANAEFLSMTSDIEAQQVIDAVEVRLSPSEGPTPTVRAAAVVCFDEERESFHAALRLRRALTRRAFEVAQEDRPLLPIYVYLPVEEGLVELIENREDSQTENRLFPLHTFGHQREVTAYDAITRDDVRRRARQIASTHRVFSGHRDETHIDFQASNKESALHSPVKFAALGIRFSEHRFLPERTQADRRRKYLLADLMAKEVLEQHALFEADERERRSKEVKGLLPYPNPYDNRIRFKPAGLDGGQEEKEEGAAAQTPVTTESNPDFSEAWPAFGVADPDGLPDFDSEALWQRLALLDRVHIPKPPAYERKDGQALSPEERESIRQRREQLKSFIAEVRHYAEKAIKRFEDELAPAGRCADVAAEMEHNRWMGERLTRGWRFGERADYQRHTMTPWAFLTEDEKHYDRAHLPRLILEQGPSAGSPGQGQAGQTPLYAYISLPLPPEAIDAPPGPDAEALESVNIPPDSSGITPANADNPVLEEKNVASPPTSGMQQ